MPPWLFVPPWLSSMHTDTQADSFWPVILLAQPAELRSYSQFLAKNIKHYAATKDSEADRNELVNHDVDYGIIY